MSTNNYNYWQQATDNTGINTAGYTYLPSPIAMTSTGVTFQTEMKFPDHVADRVTLTADGCILVDAGNYKIKIPSALFRDLLAFAQMGVLEELAGESEIAKP